MSQKHLKFAKSLQQTHLQEILNRLIYEKSIFIQSYLENDQFVFFIQNLKKLTDLTEFGIEIAYKSLQNSSLLSLLAKEIKNLSQLTKLFLKFDRQIEDIDSGKIFIELGDCLQRLSNLEDISLNLGNMNVYSDVGVINLTSRLGSLKALNKFHITIFVYNQQEELFVKQILSSLSKNLTELSISIIKYVEKGKKEKVSLNSPNILSLSEFTQLKDLKLNIDKKIKNYEFDLIGFVKSLEYLKNLNKICLKIDHMSFNQVNFSDFYDRLFQIDSLEELETNLVIFQIDKIITLGENISENSQLKILNLQLVNKDKKSTLKFGKNISKFNQFRQLSLDLKQIELSECGQQLFFQSLQKLEKFTSKLEIESLSPSFVENFQFLQQLKYLKFGINDVQKQMEGQIPFFKSIKNLINLEIIEIRYGLNPLIMNQDDLENCLKNLVHLRDFRIILWNSYHVVKNLELVAHLFKSLTQVERLQVRLEILQNPTQLKLISQNLGYLISLKSLDLNITSYLYYNEYFLRQEDIQNLLDGISNLVNLAFLNIYFDACFSNYDFLYKNLSTALQNLTRLRLMDLPYEYQFELEKQVLKLRQQYEESQIAQLIENQKYHLNLSVLSELDSSKCKFFLQQFRFLQHLTGLSIQFESNSLSDYLAFNEIAQSLSFLKDLRYLSLKISKQQSEVNLSNSLFAIGKGLQTLKFLNYFSFSIVSEETLQEDPVDELSNGLKSLKKLKQLKISLNENLEQSIIFRVICSSFSELKSLEILNISLMGRSNVNIDNEIKYLSLNLPFLNCLNTLDIQINDSLNMTETCLNEVNHSILVLKQIANFKVNFYYKQEFEPICSFINSIISIQSLQQLDICLSLNLRNQSTTMLSLGQCLAQTSNLQKLKLQLKNEYFIPQQRILAFNENFKHFQNLSELSFIISGLKVDGFQNLQSYLVANKKLNKICIQFEQEDNQDYLRYLEKALAYMSNVKDLTLSVKIKDESIALNDFFSNLSNLNQLDQLSLNVNLNFQSIDALKDCFQGLQNLKLLNLCFGESQYVNIGQIIQSLKHMINLETLFLNFNQLSNDFSLEPMRESFKYLKKLKYLQIHLMQLDIGQGLFFLNKEQGDNLIESVSYLNELIGFYFLSDIQAGHQQYIIRKLHQSLIKNQKKLRVFYSFYDYINTEKSYLKRKHLRLVQIV
ncbi:hypothetical protein ABPG72_021986 [Tetrahymena utriculariae]